MSAITDGPHVNIIPKQAKTKRKPEPVPAATSLDKAIVAIVAPVPATASAVPVAAETAPIVNAVEKSAESEATSVPVVIGKLVLFIY